MVVMMGVHDERSKRRIIGAVANFHGNPYQSSNSFLCILSCSWIFILKRQPFFLLMSFFYRKAKAFYYIHSIVLAFWGSLQVMNGNPWDITLIFVFSFIFLSCSWVFIENPKFLITHIQSVLGILYVFVHESF